MARPGAGAAGRDAVSFAAIALAGGGNRCYWQSGVLDALWAATPDRPRLMVGVSAGAFQAAFTLAGVGDRVRRIVDDECRARRRNLEWARLVQGRSPFPVGEIYPELMRAVFGPQELARLRAAPELLIKVSRPPAWLPGSLATIAGLAGYQIEKSLTNRVHPRVGRSLGFVADYVSTHAVADVDALVAALAASAAVPPFMPAGSVGGRKALDGGLVDNVPVSRLATIEAAGEPTLVLVTRRYRTLPQVPNRTYLQPSAAIAVNKFDITDADGIAAAYRLGRSDGAAFAASVASRSGRSAIDPTM